VGLEWAPQKSLAETRYSALRAPARDGTTSAKAKILLQLQQVDGPLLLRPDLVRALLHVLQIIDMHAAQLAADPPPTFLMFKMDIDGSITCLIGAVDACGSTPSIG
jgi:hypothetical protein